MGLDGQSASLALDASSNDLAVRASEQPSSVRRAGAARGSPSLALLLSAVVTLGLANLLGDLRAPRGLLGAPNFVWILLDVVPVIYAATGFGLVGSLKVSAVAVALTGPVTLLLVDGGVNRWGAWTSVAVVVSAGVLVGRQTDAVRDEARQRAIADSLLAGDQRFQLAFDDNMAAMAVVGLDGKIARANHALCVFLGRSSESLVGTSMIDYTHPDDVERSRELNRLLDSGEVAQASMIKRYVRSDGSIAVAELSKSVAKGEGGEALFAVTSIRDITEHETLTSQLAHQALHDSLTGLGNRTLLSDRMTHSLERLRRRGGQVALLLMDLDNFKDVNDTLGHLVGDQLLAAIAARLRTLVRSSDTVARFGGDEFVYFAEDLADDVDARRMASRLQGAFQEPFTLAGHVIRQGVSIGVVVSRGEPGGDAAELLRGADIALYEAKRAGRGRTVVFNHEMSQRSSLHFTLSQDLKRAVRERSLDMHYQPIIGLERGEILGFEALMRWEHATEGLISPEVFIPLAERSDLMHELGEFALQTATFDGVQWRDLTPSLAGPYISVNLSARKFHDPRLFDVIQRVLAESGLAPERLALEVTESVALSDLDATLGVLERLKSLRIVTALDDFGTGYSSLAYLARLRPDVIKIDRSFVAASSASTFDERVLEALIAMCHRLDMLVLAEGIETPRQLALLRDMGCALGQGFLFCPAVPADQVRSATQRARERWAVTPLSTE